MKSILTILFVLSVGITFGQVKQSIYAETGLNRVGFSSEIGYGLKRNKLRANIGLEMYYPNIVFQKLRPGLSAGLTYQVCTFQAVNLIVGIESAVFSEKRENHVFSLFAPLVFVGMDVKLGEKVRLNLEVGSGIISTSVRAYTQAYEYLNKSYNYMNYEISVGLSYQFNHSLFSK